MTGCKCATLAVAISFILSGCAHLEVNRAAPSPTDRPAPDVSVDRSDRLPQTDRINYNLPRTGITIVATMTLNDCDYIVANASQTSSVKLNSDGSAPPPVSVTEAYTVAFATDPDPDEEYSILVDKTRSWAKQLNLAIARNPNRTLVSFNGTITDQAGPSILAAVQTAIAIGGAVAMPALAPGALAVTAGALNHRAQTAAVSYRAKGDTFNFSKLQGIADSAARIDARVTLPIEAMRDATGAKSGDPVTDPVFRKAAEDTQRSIHKAAAASSPVAAKSDVCTPAIHAALQSIGEQQKIINAAQKKKSGGSSSSTGSSTADSKAPSVADPDVVQAQAQIARLIADNHLVRIVKWSWTPTRDELRGKFTTDGSAITLTKNADFFSFLTDPKRGDAWFNADGAKAIRAMGQPAYVRLASQIQVVLSIKSWTIGRDFGQSSLSSSATADSDPKIAKLRATYPAGIVYRDPALGALRVCVGECVSIQKPTAEVDVLTKAGGPAAKIVAADLYGTSFTDASDDLASMPIPLTQFGQINVQPMRSNLFETSSATFSQGATDGTIATVGTQSSNAAAAGFAQATAAANAASTAITARNTAITAQNGAAVSNAQFGDVVNKAIADCYTQQALIISQGGRPVGTCQ